ncbi:hypothetical protein CURE108131_25210 [Cupriavidus respiraculi]|uniref:Lysozyme n=1 Tax=Cupriavidus respiraculi TaxID=195930 RepID=A0ABM8XVB8_9BURK|nr:hypothetical protein [Cupriavidus respiraculi]CAG9184342.1 hypothetical protein LMG21510_05073 [Cupriavidus respiraculi]
MINLVKRVAGALASGKGYVLVLLVVLGLGLVIGGTSAWRWQANAYGKQLAEQRGAHKAELAEAWKDSAGWSERYRESERNAGLARDNIMAQARKEIDAEKSAAAARIAALRAGTVRLSVPVVAALPASGAGDVPAHAGPAWGLREARAELAPEAGAALYAIAVDGNAGIRDANACIDIYNAVREQVNVAGE